MPLLETEARSFLRSQKETSFPLIFKDGSLVPAFSLSPLSWNLDSYRINSRKWSFQAEYEKLYEASWEQPASACIYSCC